MADLPRSVHGAVLLKTAASAAPAELSTGTGRAASLHDTQAEAEEAAWAQAKRRHAELVITGTDGRILRGDSYGGDPARRPGSLIEVGMRNRAPGTPESDETDRSGTTGAG